MRPTFVSAAALFACVSGVARAQVVVNGQIFTNGLAIVDAPQPGTTLHAGATQSVAIDVSGNGKLPADSSNPSSTLKTHYDSLEVYLVSSAAGFNMTVSQGAGLLMQESGSTVKHINWVIDRCVPTGNYNLTFYEASHIDDQEYFIITPLPIEIQNTAVSGPCSNGTNDIQALPQAQSAPSHSPWLNADNSTTNVQYPSIDGAIGLRASLLALASPLLLLLL